MIWFTTAINKGPTGKQKLLVVRTSCHVMRELITWQEVLTSRLLQVCFQAAGRYILSCATCSFRGQPARRRHGRWQQELPLRVCPSGSDAGDKGHHQSHLVWATRERLARLTWQPFIALFTLYLHFFMGFNSLFHCLLFICAHPRVKGHHRLLGKSREVQFQLAPLFPSFPSVLSRVSEALLPTFDSCSCSSSLNCAVVFLRAVWKVRSQMVHFFGP